MYVGDYFTHLFRDIQRLDPEPGHQDPHEPSSITCSFSHKFGSLLDSLVGSLGYLTDVDVANSQT